MTADDFFGILVSHGMFLHNVNTRIYPLGAYAVTATYLSPGHHSLTIKIGSEIIQMTVRLLFVAVQTSRYVDDPGDLQTICEWIKPPSEIARTKLLLTI